MPEEIQQPNIVEVSEEQMKNFRKMVTSRVESGKVAMAGGEGDAHFYYHDEHGKVLAVTPEELTQTDFLMWQRLATYFDSVQQIGFKDTPPSVKISQDELNVYDADVSGSQNPSRGRFLGFVNNKLGAIWAFEELGKEKIPDKFKL